jgi:plasmid stabilization system protein ParE
MVRFVEAFRLANRPELGHGREDLPAPSLRFWPVGSYLVVYLGEKQPIEIVAVVHVARDVPSVVNPRLS